MDVDRDPHGGQTKDLDGDEADGFDEVIYPVDYNQAGHIVDDVSVHAVLNSLPFELTRWIAHARHHGQTPPARLSSYSHL